MEVWRSGGVEVWWCGGVEVWRCGGLEVGDGVDGACFRPALNRDDPHQVLDQLGFDIIRSPNDPNC